MAAKQPKPPATNLKQKIPIASEQSANATNTSTPTTSAATTPTTPTSAVGSTIDQTFSKLGIRRYNSRDNLLNNISNDSNNNANSNNSADSNGIAGGGSVGGAATRPACNCTNISIMHLFHEMKQEFPTIPDPIVAQCVNENCHEREKCIQMLRNELALNPIPVQTYPSKVLQQHHINQQQYNNNQLQQQKKRTQTITPSHPQPPQRHKNAAITKPTTPLRPIRAAPTKPPFANTQQRLRVDAQKFAVTPSMNCDDNVEVVQNNESNNNNIADNSRNENNLLKDVNNAQLSMCNNHSNNSNDNETNTAYEMPVAVNTAVATTDDCVSEKMGGECARSIDLLGLNKVGDMSLPTTKQFLTVNRPRPRPNTLDLQTTQQQLQRQLLNKQLQQHLQQRSQLQQQHTATDVSEITPFAAQQHLHKPLRKAPLPPIAPKPLFHNNIINNSNQYNNHNNNNNNSCGNSPQSQSGGSCSTESNLTSPISSCGENELSTNIGLQSQHFAHSSNNNNRHNINNYNNNLTFAAAPPYQQQQQQQQQPTSPLKSPIRHRSVITLQPEPPYARDFLPSPKIGTQLVTTPSSQKSFTSVNLTLRQPTTAAVPQSTIDISAGPALSGYGSGLTYSSTSFDARRGYQQNFHITVTDKGGVFNASRIRPRNSGYSGASVEERDSPGGGSPGSISPAGDIRQSVAVVTQKSPTSAQESYMLAHNNTTTEIISSPIRDDMCGPVENSALTETIKLQKNRRDKLAIALRENKNKLGHVEEEINMLTETLSASESERLDYEIDRLRNDCQLMLNEIENIRRYGQLSEAERLQLQLQQQQPFPQQRPPRARPPVSQSSQPQNPYQYQQPELGIQQQQHYTAGSNASSVGAGVGGAISYNNISGIPNSSYIIQSPNVYHQQRADYANNQPSYQSTCTDEEEYSDSNTEGGDDDDNDNADDDDGPLERWPCSMCTFLNHPQLNICEACECVRILPGTIRIVPTVVSAASTTTSTSTSTSTPTPIPTAPTTLLNANTATAAVAAAALAATAPTALGQAGVSVGVGDVDSGGVGGSAAVGPTAAAARPLVAE